MNSIKKNLFLLATASLSLFAEADLSAQTVSDGLFFLPPAQSAGLPPQRAGASSSEMRLGYCVDEMRLPGLAAQGQDGAHSFGAAIEIPSSVLDKYVGDQIETIEFAVSPARGRSCQVFVCTDLDNMIGSFLGGSSILSSVTLNSGEYKDGWNAAKLSKPVTITKGQTLYVGYNIQAMEAPYDWVIFDQSEFSMEGKNWYSLDGEWFSNTAGINRNLCIRAVVAGDNVPQNDITMLRLTPTSGSEYVNQNEPTSYTAYVQNNSPEPITSITVQVEAKGEKTAEYTTTGLNIPNNVPFKFSMDNVVIPFEGNFDGVFTITKVNGADDSDPSDNSSTQYGYSIKQGAVRENHRVLFEEFTSEGYPEAYVADTLYTNALAELSDVIRVKHHRDYQGYEDKFKLGGDEDYGALYNTEKPFVPAVCFGRHKVSSFEEVGPAYFCPYREVVPVVIQQVRNIYAFIDVDVKPVYDATANKLDVTVLGYAGVNEMPKQTGLRLTTWLVEDGILSTTQKGCEEMVQNGVLRAVLSNDGVWGDNVDISNYEFECNYSIALDPSWNKDNLRVVSFVSNWDASNVLNRAIFNVNEAKVKTGTGISDAQQGGKPGVAVFGSAVTALAGSKILGVYDMSGRQMATSQLPKGFYIVKVTNGAETATQKVYVK